MSDTEPKTFSNLSLRDALPLGYLYLIILGIFSDTIYYAILGINIMRFSTVLDVLLSPVSQITENYKSALFVVLIPAFSYFYSLLMQRFVKKAQAKKQTKKQLAVNLRLSPFQVWLMFTAFTIFSAYLGMGIGKGIATSRKMHSGKLDARHEITFNDNKTRKIRIVGNNSTYLFYVEDQEKTVTITPIEGNIKKIKKMEKTK